MNQIKMAKASNTQGRRIFYKGITCLFFFSLK